MKDITLNFGAIRDSITRLASQGIIKESKDGPLRNFISTVKKNPVLMKQHLVFKNFEDCKPFSKERLAERFIAQNLNILHGVNWGDIIKENRELRITLLENSHVESDGGNKNELFNHIQTLVESITRPGYTKINDSQNSYEYLLEFLTREVTEELKSSEKEETPNFSNWEFITEMAVSNFNKRYEHLSESDKKVFEMLISESDKKINFIKDLKIENIELIDGLLESSEIIVDDVALLESFKNKLQSDKTPEGIGYDDFILAYSELNETLKNMKVVI